MGKMRFDDSGFVKEFRSRRKSANIPVVIPAQAGIYRPAAPHFPSNSIALAERPSFVLRNNGPRLACSVPEDWRDGARLWQAISLIKERLT